ncbi:hypothetical protein HELRODRAFT_181817 [Helobdella robusta]|uniref:Uncharacterized protein n=1 Tax=Helobdella robusta TaxID=6412 RepID=T1FHD4_HELRO|nr:hypothetical protein HELRODRAFT_181817 [Helobdella robusta]ESN92041.1 hypothetical protein HELRODRAFT_181817 [Helobdella robusta]
MAVPVQFSDGDFNRMQNQLLELREMLYKSDEKCRKQEKELNAVIEEQRKLERDLTKANQDYELALNEIDSLRMKLRCYEDDFRIQNEALMKELGELVTTNETLEKELTHYRTTASTSASHSSTTNNNNDDIVDDVSIDVTATSSSLSGILATTPAAYQQKQLLLQDEVRRLQAQCNVLLKPATTAMITTEDDISVDLEMKLSIEREEKFLLKKQFSDLQGKFVERSTSLQAEVDRLNEKLKKKQESLLQLQESKDHLYNEMDTKLQNTTKDLTLSLSHLRTSYEQKVNKQTQEIEQLTKDIKSLKMKLTECETQKLESVEKQRGMDEQREQRVKEIVNDCQLNVTKYKQANDQLSERLSEVKEELKQCTDSNTKLTEDLSKLQADFTKQSDVLKQVTEVV